MKLERQPLATPGFPRPGDLCERCGYTLQGLDVAARCPECGASVAASDPALRDGLPWQNRLTPAAWLRTAGLVVLSPRQAFKRMHVGGPNALARLFMLTVALGVGVSWGLFAYLVEGRPPVVAWGFGMVAGKSTFVLTYVETLGVTGFSRRRGWRVPFGLAERVACYASVGWFGAAAVVAIALRLGEAGALQAAVRATGARWHDDYRLVAAALTVGVALLGFELLVWAGVGQVRYANTRRTDALT